MKLNTNRTPILTEDEQHQFRQAFDILDDVKAQAGEMGLPEYPKPQTQPQSLADKDIEKMSNAELGQLFTQYTAFAMYVYGQLAQAEVGYKIGVANLKHLEARLRTRLYAQDGIVKAEVPSMVRDDSLYLEADVEVLKLLAIKEILEAHYKAYSRQADALSRIIALRELDFDIQMKEMGIMGRRNKGAASNRRPAIDNFRSPKKGDG